MKLNALRRTLLIFSAVLLNTGCDQFSKNMVREHIACNTPVSVVENVFILVKVENSGALFGLGEGLPPIAKDLGLSLLPLFAISMILVYTLSRPDLPRGMTFGLCSVMGGGISNVFDRILHGSVTDFLLINLGGVFQTGVFNLADVSILAGMVLILANFRKMDPGRSFC